MTALAHISPSVIERADCEQVLVWCEQGRSALQQASTLADSQGILTVARTIEYATKVLDLSSEAIIAASKLRLRSERRCGELIAEERKAGRLASEGKPPLTVVGNDSKPATLAAVGITRDDAAAYAKLAKPTPEVFEKALDTAAAVATKARGGITRAPVLRLLDPEGEKEPNERSEDFERFIDACARTSRRFDPALTALRWGAVTKDHPWPEATINHARRTLTALAANVAEMLKELDR